MEENEDLEASEVGSHRSDDSNEVKRRFHDSMSHENRNLRSNTSWNDFRSRKHFGKHYNITAREMFWTHW